jgi:uncharacterized membrane protein YbhN (UPF0104 family)
VRRKLLAATFTAAVLVALAVFLFQNRGHILETYSLQPRVFGTIALLVVATLGLRAAANRLLFGGLGVAASLFDWFRLTCVVSFSNYLPLSAGLLAKAFFLKRVHAVPYRRFAVGQMSLLLMVFGTNGAVGLAALALAMPSQLVGVVGLGFALMLASAGLLFLPPRARSWPGLHRLPWEPHALLGARRSWPGVALCQTGILLLGAATLYLCFGLGTSHVSFATCLLFTAAAVLTRLATFTPGAIGVREFFIGALALLTGFEARDAIIASTLARVAEIAVVVVLGGAFTHSLSGELTAGRGDSGDSA